MGLPSPFRAVESLLAGSWSRLHHASSHCLLLTYLADVPPISLTREQPFVFPDLAAAVLPLDH
jgi:hypothetical protein